MTLLRRVLFVALTCAASVLSAADLTLPAGARQSVERATDLDSFDAPIGAYADGSVPARTIEGSITRRAWRIGSSGLTTLQILAPLRRQIEDLGYDVAFECESQTCGGFDFRFAIEVLPGPNMYVNIQSYRYLTAFRGPQNNPTEALTVLASVTAGSAYVQIIDAVTGVVDAPDAGAVQAVVPVEPEAQGSALPELDTLLEDGFVILQDLDFGSGTSDLGPGPFASLARLAVLLEERSNLRMALVGHTDAVGGLDANVRLSRARARAVRQRLIDEFGVSGDRLDAEGMGYLSPVASNLTAQGRSENRRVEAIPLNVE